MRAEGQYFLFSAKVIAETPQLAAGRFHQKVETLSVRDLVGFFARFRGSYRQMPEHMGRPVRVNEQLPRDFKAVTGSYGSNAA